MKETNRQNKVSRKAGKAKISKMIGKRADCQIEKAGCFDTSPAMTAKQLKERIICCCCSLQCFVE